MTDEADVIVLGLGGIGSGTAYWLAARGQRVVAFEQFELGHVRGESQDHSRIIRLSYHHPAYVDLAKGAYDAWAVVEQESGDELVVVTGGIDLFPRGGCIPMDDYTKSMDAADVPYELWDAAKTRRRYPQFHIDDDVTVVYQERSGIAAAAKANAAHQRLAREHGALLFENAPIDAIDVSAGEVTVQAGGRTVRAAQLVVCAGPWTNDVLRHFGQEFQLTVTREQVLYFSPPDLAPFTSDRFPIWIWMDEPSFYGFPVFGEPAVKVAQDAGGYQTTAQSRTFDVDEANRSRVRSFTERVIPDALGPEHLIKTCLYTMPHDRDFVVDRLPGHPEVLVFVGAGHAMKFASVLGRTLADLAIDGSTQFDLSMFKADRKALTDPSAERTWMI